VARRRMSERRRGGEPSASIRAWGGVARGVGLALLVLSLPALASAAGKCDDDGLHGAAVVAARAVIREHCDCSDATPRAAYLQCAWDVIQQLARDGAVPVMCRGRLRQYASRSTCGRGRDLMLCCESRDADHVFPALRPRKKGCRDRGGAWCIAGFPHLHDGCVTGTICRASRCGDGIVDRRNGEQCEPPGAGLCDASCRVIVCGNGVLDPGEECEPPGTPTCSPFCRAKNCGDGVVDPATESCEPPNTPSCDAQCYRIFACGDGVVDASHGEECEPPGQATCDASCQFVHICGNGVIERGEECDGQAGCSERCRLLRGGCCAFGGGCSGGGADDDFEFYWNVAKPCALLGGAMSAGACEPADPCPGPGPLGGCLVGQCVDRPIDPLPLCCQEPNGTCRDTIATMTSSLAEFGCSTFPPPDQGDVPRLMLGTCGASGLCVPAQ
jgi:hypothetical protein